MTRFGLCEAVLVDQSKIATVWKVKRAGAAAALKIYHDGDTQDEWPGVAFVQSCAGIGAVEIFDHADGAIVMEWLDGPSLGDMVHAGDDARASAILGVTAAQIHSNTTARNLPFLDDRIATLLMFKHQPHWPSAVSQTITAAQYLASQLIKKMRNIGPLHGDLHHDNIRKGPRGYLALDAKGLIGDRAYDLANAFLNPVGADDLVADCARAVRMANTLAGPVNTPAHYLLDWAIAHCALTLAWENAALPDVTMLSTLMRARLLCDGADTAIGEFNV